MARFTATPNPALPGQTVTFNGSTSSDPDGSITKYEWDLDGNGTYETNTGTTATVTRAYPTEGNVNVGMRVTDNLFGTDTEAKTLEVGNKAPVASYTANPNPAITGRNVNFNAGGSSDVDGTIVKYEWDLDGNGTFETDTGATPTTARAYPDSGTYDTRLRLTDDKGAIGTAALPVSVTSGGVSNYGDAVLDTPGLVNYWRMGETSGPTFADSKGLEPCDGDRWDVRRPRRCGSGPEPGGTLRRRRRLGAGKRQPLCHVAAHRRVLAQLGRISATTTTWRSS